VAGVAATPRTDSNSRCSSSSRSLRSAAFRSCAGDICDSSIATQLIRPSGIATHYFSPPSDIIPQPWKWCSSGRRHVPANRFSGKPRSSPSFAKPKPSNDFSHFGGRARQLPRKLLLANAFGVRGSACAPLGPRIQNPRAPRRLARTRSHRRSSDRANQSYQSDRSKPPLKFQISDLKSLLRPPPPFTDSFRSISQNRSPAGVMSPFFARAMPTENASVVPANGR